MHRYLILTREKYCTQRTPTQQFLTKARGARSRLHRHQRGTRVIICVMPRSHSKYHPNPRKFRTTASVHAIRKKKSWWCLYRKLHAHIAQVPIYMCTRVRKMCLPLHHLELHFFFLSFFLISCNWLQCLPLLFFFVQRVGWFVSALHNAGFEGKEIDCSMN